MAQWIEHRLTDKKVMSSNLAHGYIFLILLEIQNVDNMSQHSVFTKSESK